MVDFKTFIMSKDALLEDEINEVKFNEKNLEKVAMLYGKIMGKQMGGAFKSFGIESFKRKSGNGQGIRMMNSKGVQLRFNWDSKYSKKATYDLTSIDYWDKDNVDFKRPTRTVRFGPELNTMQVLGAITKSLLTGVIREGVEIITEANKVLFSKRTPAEKAEWLEANGLAKSFAKSSKVMKAKAEEAGLGEQLELFLGEPETNSLEDSLVKADKKLDATIYADPDTVFNELEDLTQMIAGRFTKSLVITGMGGIGKTYHVTEGPRSLLKTLGQAGENWELITAPAASMTSFYKDVYMMRDKIIVWDECDALFTESDIMTSLKGALDTSGENFMSYGKGTEPMVGKTTEEVLQRCAEIDEELADGAVFGPGSKDLKIPSKFQFTGSMIFISNMKIEKFRKVDSGGALMSRSLFIDIYLEATDVVKRIKTIGYAMSNGSSFDNDDIDEIVDALSDAGADAAPLVKNGIQYATAGTSRAMKGLSVRAMVVALKMKVDMKLPNWKELAMKYA